MFLAVLVTAGLTAALASPASAGIRRGWEHACGEQTFSVLSFLETSSAARGEQLREPELEQAAKEAPRRGKPDRTARAVPTYVHVVTPDGVVGSVSARSIREQLTVLDLTFGGFYGGFPAGFDFALAGITRTVNAAWFNAAIGTAAEHDMKRTLRRGGDEALNLYVTSGAGYLGWAYFPSILDTSQAYLDGVVVNWKTLPGASDAYAGRYDLGYTSTHEVGHWLNLFHTFEGACGPIGDRIGDTPAEVLPTTGCPIGKDSCPGKPGLDPVHNYMDYSYDACFTEFTVEQAARMQDAWAFWRAS